MSDYLEHIPPLVFVAMVFGWLILKSVAKRFNPLIKGHSPEQRPKGRKAGSKVPPEIRKAKRRGEGQEVTSAKIESFKAETIAKLRDYAVNEPSFTAPFMAWETGLSVTTCAVVTQYLLAKGIIREIEPHQGRYAAVYAYNPDLPPAPTSRPRAPLPELDAAIKTPRGDVVPLTGKATGPSGKPGRDRKKSALGHRVKRARQGT